MNLNEFIKIPTLDGLTSPATPNVTYFNLSKKTHEMASKLHANKDSTIFKMYWTNQVEKLSKDKSDINNTEEEVYTLDQVYTYIFESCYTNYERLYDSLKTGELLLEEIDSIFEVYKGRYEDLKKDIHIMCRINSSDDRRWIRGRVNQIQQYQDVHLALETSKIIMDIKQLICPAGKFEDLGPLLQMVNIQLFIIITNKVS